VNRLFLQQLLVLPVAGLEAGDENDDGNDNADNDGRGGGDDDVVETFGAADALGANFAALLEGNCARVDFYVF
jgi:hypothetical protein